MGGGEQLWRHPEKESVIYGRVRFGGPRLLTRHSVRVSLPLPRKAGKCDRGIPPLPTSRKKDTVLRFPFKTSFIVKIAPLCSLEASTPPPHFPPTVYKRVCVGRKTEANLFASEISILRKIPERGGFFKEAAGLPTD